MLVVGVSARHIVNSSELNNLIDLSCVFSGLHGKTTEKSKDGGGIEVQLHRQNGGFGDGTTLCSKSRR